MAPRRTFLTTHPSPVQLLPNFQTTHRVFTHQMKSTFKGTLKISKEMVLHGCLESALDASSILCLDVIYGKFYENLHCTPSHENIKKMLIACIQAYRQDYKRYLIL